MFKRWFEKELTHKLAYRRGVHLTGARQVGKSTLAGGISFVQCRRYTLDMEAVCDAARLDPCGFVKHVAGETLVIDEIQKVSALLDAVKIVLDADGAKGQYLLTGSSNLHFSKAVRDSLAGRLGRLRLRRATLNTSNGLRKTWPRPHLSVLYSTPGKRCFNLGRIFLLFRWRHLGINLNHLL